MKDGDPTPKALRELQRSAKEAIEAEGLVKLAGRLGVQPDTLQRFAFNAGRSHRGTVLLISAGLSAAKETVR